MDDEEMEMFLTAIGFVIIVIFIIGHFIGKLLW